MRFRTAVYSPHSVLEKQLNTASGLRKCAKIQKHFAKNNKHLQLILTHK
jgi:hypothetical protein